MSTRSTPIRSDPARGSAPLLDRPLDRILGTRTANQLAKQGARTAGDLLRLLPRRYDTWGELTDLRALADGEQATVQARVVRSSARRTRGGRPPAIMEATVTDGTTSMAVVMFGTAGLMKLRADQLSPGTTALLSGKVGLHRGRKQLVGPRIQVLDELDEAEREALLARPLPIYPATEALPSWRVAKAVRTLLDQLDAADVPEPLPERVRTVHGLIDAFTAYRWVHEPQDTGQWREARRRLRHEEALVLQTALAQRRARHRATRTAVAWPAPGPDSLRADLDAALPYELTAGQARVGEDIAHALESTVPMQVLLQGDVGSGKTLVALRAMIQVVGAGGQTALLAPTEVLAAQHRTSLEALLGPLGRAGMLGGAERAIRVLLLTGSTPAGRRREILAALAAGEPAIVVGTHALLAETVQIPFLGLVVVDEEQRFGVEHKETLKQLYPDVDVLSMSATPIPRTLEMAVTGVREMSTLATPPEERHPVLTYVGPKDNKQVLAAIRRELLRDGQIFYVHNRTGDMARVAAQIGELVPEARVGVAHGKMSEHQLELVIQAFWDKEIDILVCTTIVETGLDISNANTLIVEDAERFGLSQLHQLRGRVGRGRERAYAYFLYNPDKAMTETALERLRTIAANAELGSGIQVAMRDLEIRGAGNMLGGEQSGHIAGVGFDLYVRMVADAVARMRGKASEEEDADVDVRIELPVDAYLPEDYVSSERLRLEIYTKIAEAGSEGEREAVRAEMIDRYGKIPPQAERLFRIAGLREMCKEAGLAEVTMMGKNIRLAPVNLPDSRQARLKRLYPGAILKPAVRVALVPAPGDSKRMGESSVVEGDDLLDWVGMLVHSVFVATLGSSG